MRISRMMVPYRLFRRFLGLGAIAVVAGAPRAALAGDGEDPRLPGENSAAADVLFDEGKKLAEAGKVGEACPKFEASYALDRTLGTLLNMADCHEKIRKIATAWAEWGEAAERAERERDDRAAYAKSRREALVPMLPKLQVKVVNPRPGLRVLRDGSLMAEGSYGVALPVDPGKRTVVVKRGDQVLVEKTLNVTEGATATMELDLAAIDQAVAPAPPPAVGASGAPVPEPRKDESRRTLAFVVGGAGVAAVVGAGVLEALAIAAKPGNEACGEVFCSPQGFDDAGKAEDLATIGQWVGLAGLVAVGTGVVLLVTAPTSGSQGAASALSAPNRTPAASARRAPSTGPRAWISPWAGPAGGGLTVGGAL